MLASTTHGNGLFDWMRDAKSMGAYYTDVQAADFLAWWAIRSPLETMLDPAFGEGVFLRAGSERLIQLGGRPENQVYGAEIDPPVFQGTSDRMFSDYALNTRHLIHADFFSIDPNTLKVDVAIGNPPFIRYQRFTGAMRKQALGRCAAQGVRLPELCSSWAPFLVHTLAMLRQGGRLAMVLPMEVGHARYAKPVLEHVRRSFGSATFLTFREKLFPDLNEDTVLLLASEFGAPPAQFLWREIARPSDLTEIRERGCWPLTDTRTLDAPAVASGATRLIEYFIPPKAQHLYREMIRSGRAQRLGALADVGIGYVTGANDFFHLNPRQVEKYSIPEEYVKPAIRRGRALAGLRFTRDDWRRAVEIQEAGYLLHIGKNQTLTKGVRKYLEEGEAREITNGYKCRMRTPWFAVRNVYFPDAFLTYMSGAMPRLVANDAGAYAPNSLHIVRFHQSTRMAADSLAALWQTSLTRLSAEIEGHALGGGMLKLEPTEAENVLVPRLNARQIPRLMELSSELDELARKIGDDAARSRADEVVLQEMIGLTKEECKLLQSAAITLSSRRGYGEAINGAA
jgi:hypothetical protein